MDKRWYPVAFSVAMVGCGGEVDRGGPSATGGQPYGFYGPLPTSTGGSTGIIDVRFKTGTMTTSLVYGLFPNLTGGATGIGGASSTSVTTTTGGITAGGRTGIDAGTPSATGGQVMYIYGVIGVVSLRAWQRRFP
jgi:hypothetical protein